jgi:hypothetical protein
MGAAVIEALAIAASIAALAGPLALFAWLADQLTRWLD